VQVLFFYPLKILLQGVDLCGQATVEFTGNNGGAGYGVLLKNFIIKLYYVK
jgi:hypothetical protein